MIFDAFVMLCTYLRLERKVTAAFVAWGVEHAVNPYA